MISITNLQPFVELTDVPGVYAIIDETNKRVWVNWTSNFMDAFFREILTYKRSKHPLGWFPAQLTFRVLEKIRDPNDLRFAARQYKAHYEGLGYVVVSKNLVGRWKARITAIQDFRGKQQILSLVQLHGPKGKTIPVACFEKLEDAKAYLERTYDPIKRIEKHTGTLTKLYLQWLSKP